MECTLNTARDVPNSLLGLLEEIREQSDGAVSNKSSCGSQPAASELSKDSVFPHLLRSRVVNGGFQLVVVKDSVTQGAQEGSFSQLAGDGRSRPAGSAKGQEGGHDSSKQEDVVLHFSRTDVDRLKLAFAFPFSARGAFAVALAALDAKLCQ